MNLLNFTSSSSDSDNELDTLIDRAVELYRENQRPRRAPRTFVIRNREAANERLMSDYFVEEPRYNAQTFRRRFRMSKNLFQRIVTAMEERYVFFQTRYDNAGRRSFTGLQKCTSAIRQLAYGVNSDFLDEYLQMSQRTSKDACLHFCRGIREVYGAIYLRRPTPTDLQRIYEVHENVHGFPGMIGSIDCMHWPWELCPTAWRGSHTSGHVGRPSLILQAVASYDLWIWNAYFGQCGSHNDINVFESSPILEEIINGLAPTLSFIANGNQYTKGYYLGDGIYPEYATFVKTFTEPVDEKRIHFKKKQESARKGIERAFGVLKKRWRIIKYPATYWKKTDIKDVLYACIILHNMILEDEGKAICQNFNALEPSLDPNYWRQQTPMEVRIQNIHAVKNREIHNMLTADLVEQLWLNTPHDINNPTDSLADIGEYVSEDED